MFQFVGSVIVNKDLAQRAKVKDWRLKTLDWSPVPSKSLRLRSRTNITGASGARLGYVISILHKVKSEYLMI